VEVEGVVQVSLKDPFLVEPVGGAFGVAVKPESGVGDAASGDSLFDEASREDSGLVDEDAGEGKALDEGGAALVLTAREDKGILSVAQGDIDTVLGLKVLEGEAEGGKEREKVVEDISTEGEDGFTAEGELLVVEGGHSPEDEAEGGSQGFTAADGAVADDGVVVEGGGGRGPPG